MRFLRKMNLKLTRNVLVIVILVSFAFSGGYFLGVKGFIASIDNFPKVNITRETPPTRDELDFALFWRVWDTLDSKYFDKSKLVSAKMVYGAISGMVAAVGDPYTVFLPPKENKVVQEDLQGNFEGVGIQIGFIGTQLAVIAPLPDSPAEKVGVEAGDFIIGIKDEAKGVDRGTVGITIPEAVQVIRGTAGTSVTLLLLREGLDEPIAAEITRASIDVPSIVIDYVGDEGEVEEQKIAHVRLLKFSGETVVEWEETVIELLKNPKLEAIIFDVRNNPGGYLQGAVELASDFLETGSVVVIEEDGNGRRDEYRVEKLGRLKDYKMVVLINKGSASASEIFAGALRDIRGIQLVGATSFGKGTIQEPQQINGGAGFHITIAKWLTPNDVWVNEGGLVPDTEVEDDSETVEDEQLQRAIEEIHKI
jgi:carboxyl-terminal processing protease